MNPVTPVSSLRRVLGGSPDTPVLAIERWYPTTPSDMWQAFTDTERLSRWLGRIADPMPSAVGDPYRIDLGPADIADGVVLSCHPEEHLAVAWRVAGEPESVVDVSLAADGTGTMVVLQHRLARSTGLADYGGGWEDLLAALVAVVAPDTPVATRQRDEAVGREAWQRIADIQHDGGRILRVSHVAPAAIESVWDAFATVDGIGSWWWSALGATHEFNARPGGRYRFAAPGAGFAVRGTVLELDRPHHLAWSWIWEDGETDGPVERVDIELTSLDGGHATRVDIRHQGPWTDPDQSENYRIGWESTLGALVARHTV